MKGERVRLLQVHLCTFGEEEEVPLLFKVLTEAGRFPDPEHLIPP